MARKAGAGEGVGVTVGGGVKVTVTCEVTVTSGARVTSGAHEARKIKRRRVDFFMELPVNMIRNKNFIHEFSRKEIIKFG